MTSVLNGSFIRSVTKRVEDCSNPIQLREYLNRYRNYVFTEEIQEVFLERIAFFREHYHCESIHEKACDELQEDLESEIMIAKVTRSTSIVSNSKRNNHLKKLRAFDNDINLLHIQDDCDEYCPQELDLLRQVFRMTNGNKVDISRILDIDNSFLNDKINQYTLKDELNEIRRVFRNSSKK